MHRGMKYLTAGTRQADSDLEPVDPADSVPVHDVNPEILAMVFHELCTPLTVIKEFTSIMKDGLGGSITPKQASFLEIVLRNATKIEDMIQDLRDYTLLMSGDRLDLQLEILELGPIVEDALDGLRQTIQSKALSVQYVPCCTPIWVLGDHRHLSRAVRHVISNAVRFTPDSGAFGVKTYTERGHARPEARLAVEDRGIGIDPDEVERVLHPFYQARGASRVAAGGLGLGLTVTRKIVEEHDGSLYLASGKGTVVLLSMPLHPDRNPLQERRAARRQMRS